jgi:hypothetical protein
VTPACTPATVHGRYGIFIGCDEPQRTTFYFRHPDDGAEVELPSCATRGSLGDTVTVSGALTGADENAFVDVFVGGDFADTTDIAYTGVAPAGAGRGDGGGVVVSTRSPPSRMLRHDLGVLADDATLDLVFDDAIAPAQADNEVIGIDPAEELQISVSVHRGDAQVGSWFEFIDPGVLTFTTLPGALREADDTLAVDHFANLDRARDDAYALAAAPHRRRRRTADRLAATTARLRGAIDRHLRRAAAELRAARPGAGDGRDPDGVCLYDHRRVPGLDRDRHRQVGQRRRRTRVRQPRRLRGLEPGVGGSRRMAPGA